jgi:branched-chain amino acid transport system ATP-binding protein
MLTICRALMGRPRLILVDEPTEGLSLAMVEQVAVLLREVARRGVAILLVEQKLTIALQLCDRVNVMGHGRIVFDGSVAEFEADPRVRANWLEV